MISNAEVNQNSLVASKGRRSSDSLRSHGRELETAAPRRKPRTRIDNMSAADVMFSRKNNESTGTFGFSNDDLDRATDVESESENEAPAPKVSEVDVQSTKIVQPTFSKIDDCESDWFSEWSECESDVNTKNNTNIKTKGSTPMKPSAERKKKKKKKKKKSSSQVKREKEAAAVETEDNVDGLEKSSERKRRPKTSKGKTSRSSRGRKAARGDFTEDEDTERERSVSVARSTRESTRQRKQRLANDGPRPRDKSVSRKERLPTSAPLLDALVDEDRSRSRSKSRAGSVGRSRARSIGRRGARGGGRSKSRTRKGSVERKAAAKESGGRGRSPSNTSAWKLDEDMESIVKAQKEMERKSILDKSRRGPMRDRSRSTSRVRDGSYRRSASDIPLTDNLQDQKHTATSSYLPSGLEGKSKLESGRSRASDDTALSRSAQRRTMLGSHLGKLGVNTHASGAATAHPDGYGRGNPEGLGSDSASLPDASPSSVSLSGADAKLKGPKMSSVDNNNWTYAMDDILQHRSVRPGEAHLRSTGQSCRGLIESSPTRANKGTVQYRQNAVTSILDGKASTQQRSSRSNGSGKNPSYRSTKTVADPKPPAHRHARPLSMTAHGATTLTDSPPPAHRHARPLSMTAHSASLPVSPWKNSRLGTSTHVSSRRTQNVRSSSVSKLSSPPSSLNKLLSPLAPSSPRRHSNMFTSATVGIQGPSSPRRHSTAYKGPSYSVSPRRRSNVASLQVFSSLRKAPKHTAL